jgi:hypothetical protein
VEVPAIPFFADNTAALIHELEPEAWIAADFLRLEDGIRAEHWGVIEDEASREQSLSGLPTYGDDFPEER